MMTTSPPALATSAVTFGGLGFAVAGPVRAWEGSWAFRPEGLPPTVSVKTMVARPAQEGLGPVLFDPGSFWTARAHPRGFAIAIVGPSASGPLARLAVMDPTWTTGEVHVHPDLPVPGCPRPALAWPLDTLLSASLLAHRGGLLVHGAGLAVNGAGYLFSGPSGAGKSTIVKLLERGGGVAVLNDERCIVRREGSAWLLYGTPWHGEVERVAYGGVPLHKVFLLDQASAHRATPLGPAEAARRLFGRCLWPFWDRAGMRSGLAVLEGLCREVPCFTLKFRRDAGVLACILE